MKIWIARDRDDMRLCVYREQPQIDKKYELAWAAHTVGDYFEISGMEFPELEPGECYEAEIKLGEKV